MSRRTTLRRAHRLLAAVTLFFFIGTSAAQAKAQTALSARSAVIVDASGNVIFKKNPRLRLPAASTTKVMTVWIASRRLFPDRLVPVSRTACQVEPSKADLTLGASYFAKDLMTACLVASSNDAAIALAEAVSGSEEEFVKLMNREALALGMKDTRFVNATGLPDKRHKQYSTAYDLTLLMRRASSDPRLDLMMGLLSISFKGSDGRQITLRNHNKMLWRMPGSVKGKTGWTFASKHTFVGTDYGAKKRMTLALLSSEKPWSDIGWLFQTGERAVPSGGGGWLRRAG